MTISPDEAWLILRGYSEDAALVLAAVVVEGVLSCVVLGRIVKCGDICEVRGDGFTVLSFPRHALDRAEYADPREALPLVRDAISADRLESGLRLDFGPTRWGFMLRMKDAR